MATVPASLLPQQSAMSQATPASVAGADKGAHAVSQQQDSAAVRVSVGSSMVVLGSSVLGVLCVMALCW